MIHVLIVEDDPMVAELNRCYLAKLEGFCLAGIAGNYLQALEKLKTDAIDLILMDIFMPGINGLELLAKIRETGHGVDVIMVTAARNTDSVKQALRLGADGRAVLRRCRQACKSLCTPTSPVGF